MIVLCLDEPSKYDLIIRGRVISLSDKHVPSKIHIFNSIQSILAFVYAMSIQYG